MISPQIRAGTIEAIDPVTSSTSRSKSVFDRHEAKANLMVQTVQHWPTELRVTEAGRVLRVTFENAQSFDLPAELLRVSSPSAEVQGHSAAGKQVVGGKRAVAIAGVEPVGHYAVKLRFDDGHDTGLFTWAYLHELGSGQDAIWSAYLADLATKGLSRD
jgi:DUF971 family protein